MYLIFRREEFLKRILHMVDRKKNLINYYRNIVPHPSTKPPDTSQSKSSKSPEEKERLVKVKKFGSCN